MVSPPSTQPHLQVYKHLDMEVRTTLHRSYVDRIAKVPRAEGAVTPAHKTRHGNMANSFFGGMPATFWDAIERISDRDLNIIAVIYQRLQRVDLGIWPEIRWIRQWWVGSSAGFNCEYKDRTVIRGIYEASQNLCQDWGPGRQGHPDCDCWREIVGLYSPDTSGMHCLIGMSDAWLDQIHLDWVDPATGAVPFMKSCDYDKTRSAAHLLQVYANVAVVDSPFLTSDTLNSVHEYIKAIEKREGAGVAAPFKSEHERIKKIWKRNHRRWACLGEVGWAKASPVFAQSKALLGTARATYMASISPFTPQLLPF